MGPLRNTGRYMTVYGSVFEYKNFEINPDINRKHLEHFFDLNVTKPCHVTGYSSRLHLHFIGTTTKNCRLIFDIQEFTS